MLGSALKTAFLMPGTEQQTITTVMITETAATAAVMVHQDTARRVTALAQAMALVTLLTTETATAQTTTVTDMTDMSVDSSIRQATK